MAEQDTSVQDALRDIRIDYGCEDNTVIEENILRWYQQTSSDDAQSLRLLYVRRRVLTRLMSEARERVNRQVGPDRIDAAQIFQHLRQQLAELNGEINDALGASPTTSGVATSVPGKNYYSDDDPADCTQLNRPWGSSGNAKSCGKI